jgi:hypothetical protein
MAEGLFEKAGEKKEEPKPVEGAGGEKKEGEPELPENLKGKSPAELAAIIQEQGTQLANVLPRVEELTKQILSQPEPKGDPQPKVDEPPDPRIDPEGYYQHLHQKNVQPLAKEAFERFADYERDKVKSKFKDFNRWEKEVDELVGQMPLELRARKGSFEMAYRIVKGKHIEELEKEFETKTGGPAFSEPASPASRREAPQVEPLTDIQQQICKNMNLSEEEYRTWQGISSPPERKAN